MPDAVVVIAADGDQMVICWHGNVRALDAEPAGEHTVETHDQSAVKAFLPQAHVNDLAVRTDL